MLTDGSIRNVMKRNEAKISLDSAERTSVAIGTEVSSVGATLTVLRVEAGKDLG